MALTKNQKSKLLSVANHWGPVFKVYFDYGFMTREGLVRRATQAEIDQYYDDQKIELADTKRDIIVALSQDNYKEVKRLADHAEYLASVIADREEEQDSLYTFNEKGEALVAKLNAALEAMNG